MRKKTTIALMALAAAAPAAMAQSAVTVFGRVDVGLQHIDNGDKQTRVDSGTYTASRLGFRGTEDLGGGLQALFFLESGLNADVGAAQGGNRFFNRGSYVGLSSKDWGTVTLGRQYVPIFWPFLFADDTGPLRLHGYSAVQSIQRSNFLRVNAGALEKPVANGTIGSTSAGVYSVGISSAFENNLVVYKTPSFSGLTVTGAVGAGEGYGDAGKVLGANAEYKSGPLYLGAGYTQKRGVAAASGREQKVTETMVGGMYSVTQALNLWTNIHPWKYETGATAGGSIDGRDFMVGLSYKLPTGQLWANYAAKRIDDCSSCDSSGFGIGYHHLLSKRTELYASLGRVANDDNAANSLNGFSPIRAGQSVRGIGVGIAHQF